ncbi:MAG: recombinase family protein [Clostridia bacterium]
MKKAVIYARYSSDSQTEQSIEGQVRVCQEYARANNILIVDTYIDRAMTGTNDLRPDFQRMIKDSSKQQWNFVIVYKLDRFSRDKYETTIHKHTLKDNDVKLISAMENIPDSPEGIILESLLEGMNQYYSAELSQKVHRGLNESYRKGNFTGGSHIYGYDIVDKKNVINSEESEIVKEIFTKYAQGYTAVAIANELKMRGIRTKKGKYIDSVKLYKILVNTKYNGKIKHGEVVYDNIYPPIVDDATWQKVQDVHHTNKHAPGRKKEIFDFILSGKLICGDCKRMMVGESGTSHTNAKHYYYSCLTRRRKKQPCKTQSVSKQWLEDIVINTTWAFLSDKKTVQTIAETLFKLHQTESKVNSNLKSLESKRMISLKASQNLITAIEQGIITEQTKTRLKELEAQISQYDFDIEQERQRSYTFLTMEMIEKYLNAVICGDIQEMSVRKLIVKTFIREVILENDTIIITYYFTEQYSKHDITPEETTLIQKQSKKQTASFLNLGSYKLADFPPNEA